MSLTFKNIISSVKRPGRCCTFHSWSRTDLIKPSLRFFFLFFFFGGGGGGIYSLLQREPMGRRKIYGIAVFSTLFHSNRADEIVILNGCVQWNLFTVGRKKLSSYLNTSVFNPLSCYRAPSNVSNFSDLNYTRCTVGSSYSLTWISRSESV